MKVVLDASMALSWRFEDERTAAGDAVLRQIVDFGAIAPSLWPIELANGLHQAARRKRITPAYVDASLIELAKLDIEIDSETAAHAWSETMSLARANGLTLYDAAYLELALRRGLPLATLDAQLRTAASALGVQVLGL